MTTLKKLHHRNTKHSIEHGFASVALWLPALMLLFPLHSFASRNADIDSLITSFDRAPGIATANRFFRLLDREQFSEEPINFKPDTPADSVNKVFWYWAAEWLYDNQEYASARDYALRALPLFRYPNEDKAYCLNLLGVASVRLGNFGDAVTYAKHALDIFMLLGNADDISSAMNTLAGTYMAAGQPQNAEQYILQGLEYADRANNPRRKAILLGMASEVYLRLDQNDKSLDYASRAYSLDSLMGNTGRLPVRLSMKAAALDALGRVNDARSAYNLAIEGLRATGNKQSLAITLNKLGFLLQKNGQSAEAVDCFNEARELFSSLGDLYNLVMSQKGLYESYWKINPDSARIALDRFNQLKDSLYSNATADALAKYHAAFDNDRLKAENEALQRNNYIGIAIAVIILLVVIAVALWCMAAIRSRHRREMLEMLAMIKRSENAPETSSESESLSPEASFLQQVVDLVEDGIENDISRCSVAFIAKQLSISEQTFRRRVREATGQSPKTFISAIVMERAARMLSDTPEIPVADIAAKFGFEDASGFTHAFKRVFGCTPTQYRSNHI
ncbi:MAG: helix-turn-helix domain-containing protein [Muribaculaceae bacterium]